MNFLPARMSPSMTSFSGCTRRWLFHRSLKFFLGRFRRWLLFQVAHIADFFPGRARWWFFPTLRTSLISFSWSHDSVADFFFRLSLSITSFSQVAPVKKLFFILRSSLIFFQVVLIDGFFASSHESFADFFFRLRTSLTFFTGRARCWFLFQVAHIADSFPGRTRCWFFPRLRMSLIIFPGGTSTSMTSFLGCAHRWRFHRSRSSLTFFLMLRSSLIFFQVVLIDEFFASSLESFDDFFFRLRPTLTFSQVADFFFSLRTSLTFFQVAAVADFSPGYACRWFFSRVARVPRWLPS